MTDDRLARRYRTLLACYPWEHRRAYEDEMLGVLLMDALPGQRRPGLGEATNLVLSGLGTRLSASVRSLADRRWAQAAATVGLFGAVVLLVHRLHEVVGLLVMSMDWPQGDPAPYVSTRLWLSVLAWTAVVIAASTGLRRTAALLGWAVAVAQLLSLGSSDSFILIAPYEVWLLALGLVTAVALTVPAAGVAATRILNRPGLWSIGAAAALTIAAPLVGNLPIPYVGPSALGQLLVLGRLISVPALVLYLVAGLLALMTLAWTPGPVRRRMLVILLPVLAMAAVASDGGSVGLLDAQLTDVSYVHLGLWIELAVAPVVSFVIGVALLRRRERTLRLLAIGRRNDHSDWAAPASTDTPDQ